MEQEEDKGAGRPKESFKFRHPVTNLPISAYDYRKLEKRERNKKKLEFEAVKKEVMKDVVEDKEKTLNELIKVRQYVDNLIRAEVKLIN